MNAAHALLENAVDYAGLFPPAGLGMDEAVRNYAEYRSGTESWALGRFVVPARRLEEFGRAHRSLGQLDDAPWALSVLCGSELHDSLALIDAHRDDAWRVEALELKADDVDGIAGIATTAPITYERFVEIPLGGDIDTLVEVLALNGLRPKVRTGGLTAEAFPTAERLAHFLAVCVQRGVGFKATAGLHHARRGAYPLTYESDSPAATMYGYLNVFGAAALLQLGGTQREAVKVLLETDEEALRLESSALVWRGRRIDVKGLHSMRRATLRSFGSCSFLEPLEELGSVRDA